MTRARSHGFQMGDEWRDLKDPTGSPTWKQLLNSMRRGALKLATGAATPIDKAEAAWMLNEAEEREATDAPRPNHGGERYEGGAAGKNRCGLYRCGLSAPPGERDSSIKLGQLW